MKTFKLKGLIIMPNEEVGIQQQQVELNDGLVINREDEQGWLIEAFIDKKYQSYFATLKKHEEIMVQVKITREENDPAFFITNIITVNQISDDNINVLFQGKVIDHSKKRIEKMLQMIIEEGYQGASILKKFKELL